MAYEPFNLRDDKCGYTKLSELRMSARLLNKTNLQALALPNVNTRPVAGPCDYNISDDSRLQLLQQFEAVKDAERQRLSRELHDQIGQDLIALSLGIRSLKKEMLDAPDALAQLEQLQEMVSRLDQRVHDFAWELRPLILDDLGLVAAIDTLIEKWSVKNAVASDFQCSGIENLKLPINVENGLYRIVQEALTNISKHAEANSVTVTVQFQSGALLVVISDDGQGFDVAAIRKMARNGKSFGLLGMLERAELIGGALDISSTINYGTSIKVSIPLFSRKKGRYVQTTCLSC